MQRIVHSQHVNHGNQVTVQRMLKSTMGSYQQDSDSDSGDNQEEKKRATQIDPNALADFYISEDEEKDQPQNTNKPIGLSNYSSVEEKFTSQQQDSGFGDVSVPLGFGADYDSGPEEERKRYESEGEDWGGLPPLDEEAEKALALSHEKWQKEFAEAEKKKQEELQKKQEERKSREEYEKYVPMSDNRLGKYPESTLSKQVIASNKSYPESEGKKLGSPLLSKDESGVPRVNFKHMDEKAQPFVTAYNKSRSYHSTTKENAQIVRKEGLDPKKRGGKGGAEWQQAKAHLEKEGDSKSEITDEAIDQEVKKRGKDKDRQGVFMTQHRGVAEGYPQNVAREDKSLLRIYQTPKQTEGIVPDVEYTRGMTAESHYYDDGVGYRPTVVPPSDIAFGKFADVNKDGTEDAQKSKGEGTKEDHLYEIIATNWEGGKAPTIEEIRQMHEEAIQSGYVSD